MLRLKLAQQDRLPSMVCADNGVIKTTDCNSVHIDRSPQGATSFNQCACNAGYIGTGPCSACALGKYKSSVSSIGCIDCPAQFTSDILAATNISACRCNARWTGQPGVTQCTACPAGSTSERGSISSNSCQCAPGYTGPGSSSCTACPKNTYKSRLGSGVCQSCPVSLSSPSGTDHIAKCSCMTGFEFNSELQRCLVCSPNSHNEAGNISSRCSCNPGFTGPDGGPCTACATGTFKNVACSAPCVACTMSDSSPAPSTADRKACATCSSFGVFGTPSGYPPKPDTSLVQVLDGTR